MEVGLLVFEHGQPAGRLVQLINPECRIDHYSRMVHHISDHMVAGEPTFLSLWSSLGPLLDGAVVTAHYAPFDSGALRNEIRRLRLAPPRVQWWCTCRFARCLWPHFECHKLEALARHFQLSDTCEHRAGSDAQLAAGLLKVELGQAYERGCQSLEDVHPFARHQGASWPFS